MEYIVEMNNDHQLVLPETVIKHFELKPGAHFTVRTENGRLIIEYLPFSSFDQAKALDATITGLKN
jgi:antitoxin component of MazEF toxin-antitoxin module